MFGVVGLLEAARKCAGVDERLASDVELFDAAVALEQVLSAVQVAQAHVLAELDSRDACDTSFGMRTVSWVAAEANTARGPLRSRLRVGKALRQHFGVIDEAVSAGGLSFEHARTLTNSVNPRVVDAMAAAQDEIIGLAKDSTFTRWRNDLAALVEHADTDGPEPDDPANSQLTASTTLDGITHLRGTLDVASGLTFKTTLDAKTDELYLRYRTDSEESNGQITVPDRATLRAFALVELIRTATGAEPGSGTAPRAEVTLLVHDHEITDSNGVPLPQAAADIWGCDPDVWAVVVDHMGIPVDVGHAKRLATTAQRRAIAIRDGGCVFPGCDAPIDWCDTHHIQPWQHGGATDLANLVALCRHHHGVTHRTGWTMHNDHNQHPSWQTPTGFVIHGQRHHRRTKPPNPGRPPDKPPNQSAEPPDPVHRPDEPSNQSARPSESPGQPTALAWVSDRR